MGWYRRLRNLIRPDQVDRDIDRELTFHIAERVDEHISSGMSQDEALRKAKRQLGNYAIHKERTRDMDIHVSIESIGKDIRYAARALRKNPGFTIVAVVTLALGIGANTVIFSVVNGVLLRPLPYKDADQLVMLSQRNIQSGAREDGATPANFLDWRDQNQAFEKMAAAEPYTHNMVENGEPESFRSWLVTEGFFEILGVEALLGRTFTAEDYQLGNQFVIVIGHGLWRNRFGADPTLIGRQLRLNGQPHMVVGVMPPEFQVPSGRQVWAPRIAREIDRRLRGGTGYLPVIGRLKPESTIAQAQHEMESIAERLAQEYPQTNANRGVLAIPLREQTVGQVRLPLLVLLGAVGLVLLIACANVANLLLVRAVEREREFAIRGALGAGRGRLTRQCLIESLWLALLGGSIGVLLAYWGLRTTLRLSPNDLPRISEISIDGRVLAFTLAVSMFSALFFGLAPVLRFIRPNLNDSLREGGRSIAGFTRSRFRRALVVSEIALALILLVGAGLLIRSFVRLLQVNPGFGVDHVLALEVHIWGLTRTPEQRAAFFEQTLDRINALQGVEAAGAVSALPFHDNQISTITAFTIEGRPALLRGQEPTAYFTSAAGDYFKALDIPLRRGRLFTRFDRQGAPPVALINETLANLHWPGEDPVGKKIKTVFFGQNLICEVIGIVGDVRPTGLESNPRPELFVPHLQQPSGSMTYVARTAGDPVMWLSNVKKEIWAVEKRLPFASTATMDQLVSRSFGARRFNLALLGSFAVIALTLAGVGIYGLISFSTRQRSNEIRIRMTLGATQPTILRMILGEGLLLTMLGVIIGLAGALALTRFLQSLLFGVEVTDPLTFAGVTALLVAVALLATYIPAHRTTKMDPMPGR